MREVKAQDGIYCSHATRGLITIHRQRHMHTHLHCEISGEARHSRLSTASGLVQLRHPAAHCWHPATLAPCKLHACATASMVWLVPITVRMGAAARQEHSKGEGK